MPTAAEIKALKDEIQELEQFYRLLVVRTINEKNLPTLSSSSLNVSLLPYLKLDHAKSAEHYESIKEQFETLVTEIANTELVGPRIRAGETILRISAAMLALNGTDATYEKMALMFLKRDKDINRANSLGCTALLYAAMKNSVEVAKYLIEERRADPQIKSKWGNQALDLAKRDTIDLIRKNRVDQFIKEIPKGIFFEEDLVKLLNDKKYKDFKIQPQDIYQCMLHNLKEKSGEYEKLAFILENWTLVRLFPESREKQSVLKKMENHRDYFNPVPYGSHTSKLYINGKIAPSTMETVDQTLEKWGDMIQDQNKYKL
jgi:hypothetical protein